jgi:hypothetical protein
MKTFTVTRNEQIRRILTWESVEAETAEEAREIVYEASIPADYEYEKNLDSDTDVWENKKD